MSPSQNPDTDAIRALLAPPTVSELAPRREAQLRRAFADEVRHQAPDPVRSPLRRPAFAAAGFAAVAAAAVIVATSGPHTPSGSQVASVVEPVARASAVPVLRDVAYVVLRQSAPVPASHSYEYIESIGAFTSPTRARTATGPVTLGQITRRETWLAQTPTQVHLDGSGVAIDGVPQREYDLGLVRSEGRNTPILGTEPEVPTYAELEGYPADPQALLDRIAATLRSSGQTVTPAAEFDRIGALLDEAIMPPQVAAAMYRAAALIPGIELIDVSTDAAGRHGFAIAFTADGVRSEWIFDRATKAFLGERDLLVSRTAAGPAGTLVGTTAILQRGVAGSAGELPLGKAASRNDRTGGNPIA